MQYSLRNELPALVVALLPLAYLFMIWNTLPDLVPIHWNVAGEIDKYGKKTSLLWIPFLLPVLTYLLFLIAPLMDAKKRLQNMGEKFTKLKFALTFVMAVLSLFIIHSTQQQELNPNALTIIIGALYVVSGNFFPTLKPNYFIGIKIPSTLKNEHNWKQTHQFAGKLWLIGGLSIVASGLFSKPEINNLFFFLITLLITLIPTLYSYSLHKQDKKRN